VKQAAESLAMANEWMFLVLGLAIVVLLGWLGINSIRMSREKMLEAASQIERQRQLDEQMAALQRLQAEAAGRMQTMTESFGQRQGDLARLFTERLDSLQNRVGDGLKENVKETTENLSKLNERLAVIDAAQKNLTSLTSEVLTLKDVLSNKQTRGAFGQGRMEAVIRDALPPNSYEFQATLPGGKRPDCIIRLPNDPRPLVIDAKFPLESVTAFREAQNDEAKKLAMVRVRGDIGTHLKDIADKYIVRGVTQEIAVMFVPSESIYADLHEFFDDVIQKAQRARIMIVSPSLLMMAVQMLQVIVRDSQMREQAHLVQMEVGKILDDVNRLRDRVTKLDTHFRQAQEDIVHITTSADKVARRGEKITSMELEPENTGVVTELLPRTQLEHSELL
jgi:DNA recombination protein RmuC